MKKNTERMRKFTLYLILLLAIAVVIAQPLKMELSYPVAVAERVSFKNQNAKKSSHAFGTMNGIEFSIPRIYLHFPVQYAGQSPWDQKSGYGHPSADDSSSDITSFSLYVEWPELAPHTKKNHESYRASFKPFKADNWVRIGVSTRGEGPIPETDVYGRNSLARILNGIIDDSYETLPDNVQYEVQQGTYQDINYAFIVAPGVEQAAIWNRTIYWDGDRDGIVSTLVQCDAGELSTTSWVHDCSHRFRLDEINSQVVLSYASSLLPQWSQIEEKTKRLITSFMKRLIKDGDSEDN